MRKKLIYYQCSSVERDCIRTWNTEVSGEKYEDGLTLQMLSNSPLLLGIIQSNIGKQHDIANRGSYRQKTNDSVLDSHLVEQTIYYILNEPLRVNLIDDPT